MYKNIFILILLLTVNNVGFSQSKEEKVDIILNKLESVYSKYLFPSARTEPDVDYFYRFYSSPVKSVAIGRTSDDVWYYFKGEWVYFNTLDGTSDLLCDGGCFKNEDVCLSPSIDMTGSVGYSIRGSRLTLNADKVKNNTQQNCISETLELSLWAEPDDSHFYVLGDKELGQLKSNFFYSDVELVTDLKTNIPNGNYDISLNVVSQSKKNTPLAERRFKDQINITNGVLKILDGVTGTGTGGSGGSGGAACPAGTDTPYGDIQIDSQCQAACFYLANGQTQGVIASCEILKGWENHTSIRASACGAC